MRIAVLVLSLVFACGCHTPHQSPTPAPVSATRSAGIKITFQIPASAEAVWALKQAGATSVSATVWTLDYDWENSAHGDAIYAAAKEGATIGPR